MALFKGTPTPKQPVPVPDQISGPSFRWTLAKFIALPLVPILLLAWFGSPALRVTYVWNGDQPPVYYECLYLNLTSGWQRVYPPYAVNNCPLVAFSPFNIADLFGGSK